MSRRLQLEYAYVCVYVYAYVRRLRDYAYDYVSMSMPMSSLCLRLRLRSSFSFVGLCCKNFVSRSRSCCLTVSDFRWSSEWITGLVITNRPELLHLKWRSQRKAPLPQPRYGNYMWGGALEFGSPIPTKCPTLWGDWGIVWSQWAPPPRWTSSHIINEDICGALKCCQSGPPGPTKAPILWPWPGA